MAGWALHLIPRGLRACREEDEVSGRDLTMWQKPRRSIHLFNRRCEPMANYLGPLFYFFRPRYPYLGSDSKFHASTEISGIATAKRTCETRSRRPLDVCLALRLRCV